MQQITPSQAEVLSRPVVQGFAARAVRFLKGEFPALAEKIDAASFDHFVAHGQRQAVRYGFASERQIVQYLLVMMYLGPRFDEDPRLATLRPFLDPASTMPPPWRLNVLIGATRGRPEPGTRHAH